MSFGRNPHVAKAEAAELKATSARDDTAREQAWREAARQWERAADREQNDKRKAEYSQRADAARATADGEPLPEDELEPPSAGAADKTLLN
jgi:hypothetical protein